MSLDVTEVVTTLPVVTPLEARIGIRIIAGQTVRLLARRAGHPSEPFDRVHSSTLPGRAEEADAVA